MTFAGIPYVLSGGKRFQDKMEIRDAIAYLRLAANPDDTNAFERVVNTPKRGMGDVAVKKIIDAVDKARAVNAGISLIDIARNYTVGKSLPGEVPAKLRPFINAIENGNKMFWSGNTAAQVMEQVLTEAGYFEDLDFQIREAKENEENAVVETTQHRIDNIRDLITLGNDMTPLKLIEHLGLAEDGRSKKATGVWIGTIHASKGLEWPYVIGVGWEDNVLPSWQALADGGETLAEERRCGYVEITRARKSLTLTTTGERFQKPAIRSRFLNEIPSDSCEEFNIEPDEEIY
jgi:DNA helicase-2/ATP-dependent DNA helicase PcrA